MALLKAEAAKLSRNELVRGVIEEIITKDSVFNVLPFVPVNGKAYVYNRENSISEGDFLDPNDTVNEGAATFTEVTTNLRILAGDVDVDKFLMETMGDTNDQLAVQIALKGKALARKFERTLAIGNSGSNAKEFDGMAALSVAGQTMTAGANGAALTLGMLDQLLDMVPNGADAIVMRSGTIRAYKDLLRTIGGGTDASMLQLENFSRPMLTHNGVPILVNDFLPGNETQGSSSVTCSVYAVRLNELDGLHGIYGGPSAGIRVEEVGTVQNKDAWRVRLKWYCGVALKSTQSLARIKGLTNI
jgi:hypothetical protein